MFGFTGAVGDIEGGKKKKERRNLFERPIKIDCLRHFYGRKKKKGKASLNYFL